MKFKILLDGEVQFYIGTKKGLLSVFPEVKILSENKYKTK